MTDFIIATQIAIVILAGILLYAHFVLPATLSKEAWYTDYLQLRDHIKSVETYTGYQAAMQAYYKFTNDKAQAKNPHHQRCTRRIEKLLKKKYPIYKNRMITA